MISRFMGDHIQACRDDSDVSVALQQVILNIMMELSKCSDTRETRSGTFLCGISKEMWTIQEPA